MGLNSKIQKNAVIVMLKAPRVGEVKTRLAVSIGEAQAATLYSLFIKDTFNMLSALDFNVDLYAAYTPLDALEEVSALLGKSRVQFFPQRGADLGERMLNAFKELFGKGYAKVVMIGSDSPDLPLKYIQDAFSLSDENQNSIVLGPSNDGGYYLIAMQRMFEEVFNGVRWSTGSVLDDTLSIAKANSIVPFLLEKWYDIDTYEDLFLLKTDSALQSVAFLRDKGIIT